MEHNIVITPNAPAPIGPYSQAVAINGLLYVSGQICIDPSTNELKNSSIEEECEQVMKNIEAILSAGGHQFKNIVKTSIFLSDMNHFATVNSIYSKYFTSNFPARETVAVLGLPKNVNVEISVISYK